MIAFAISNLVAGKAVAGGDNEAAAMDGTRAQEWWLTSLDVPSAWQATHGAGVTVAVLNTGVAADSPDLTGDVITGPDYTGSGRTQTGPYWGACGTAVASIIAGHGHGTGGNSGIMGIAPAAKILSVRVTLEYDDPLNSTASITRGLTSAIANGITYAVSHGAKVVDLPLDPGTFGMAGDGAASGGSAAEQAAVRYALAKGVVLIAPSGDDGAGASQVNYPAAYPGVLAVGAVSRGGQVASFSSRHSYVTVTGPGVALLADSVVPDGSGYAPGYSHISTTSVASGMAAGIAALIVSRYPSLTPAQVTQALRQSATGPAAVVSAAVALRVAGTLSAKPAPVAPGSPHHTAPAASRPAFARPAAAPHPASAVASSVLHDAVYGVGGLIALVFVVLLFTQARRARRGAATANATVVPAESGRARPRGQHELKRRGNGEPSDVEVLARLRQPAHQGAPVRIERTWPDGDGAADWRGSREWPGADWHAGTDWQGSSLGEIEHFSPTEFTDPSRSRPGGGPAIEPMPRPASTAPDEQSSPPWEPAPEPAEPLGPLPLPALPPAAFASADLDRPFAGRDVLTQDQFGFAAAPVPVDFDTEEFPAVPRQDGDQPEDESA